MSAEPERPAASEPLRPDVEATLAARKENLERLSGVQSEHLEASAAPDTSAIPPLPAEPTTPAEAAPAKAASALPGVAWGLAELQRRIGRDLLGPPPPTRETVTLRNARAGEPYEAELPELDALVLEDDAGTRLVIDSDGRRLTGTPQVAGEHLLRLTGERNGRPVEVTARLAVIPDPRSLFVAKDSDRADPFWKEDEAFCMVAADLFCVGASKRGRSHAKDGGFREDDFGLQAAPGGWHVGVVADGAGSARFSRRGSQVAVRTALDTLPPLLDEHLGAPLEALVARHGAGDAAAAGELRTLLYQSLVTTAFNSAVAVEKEAAAIGAKPADLSTTLILVAARRVAAGWFAAAFSIGDGGAALFDAETGEVIVLTSADSGEFAGQTRFLARSEFADSAATANRIAFAVRPRFTALALMSDGITDPKFPTDHVFADAGAWQRFWHDDLVPAVGLDPADPALRDRLLGWMDFWSPGNHDDRTLALMLPREPA